MDFEQFEGIVEVDETYFYTRKKGRVTLLGVNLVNVAGNPSTEESVTNRFVFWWRETVQKQLSPKLLVWDVL
ncbi:hypothetical protein BA724_17500 [Domibacillus iocasae]|uniref:Transposase n=1 Tax=Domibacillus iocasae TaxID=1714016 RepID=A0A1E7DQT6_9BACI|nr:hypothetical protein BA724_17500 [Domibacillus iocasae]